MAMNGDLQIRNLLATDPELSNEDGIFTVGAWSKRRREILDSLNELLGIPSSTLDAPSQFEVLDAVEFPHYTKQKIRYQTEPGMDTHAYLLVPHDKSRAHPISGRLPAVLCQHGSAVAGKETQVVAKTPGMRNFAHQLAVNGFITLAPDYFTAGESVPVDGDAYDTDPFYSRHPAWSAVGKAVHDGRCAIDILGTHPDVDTERIGVVGYSMGGQHSIFLAGLDERVSVVASTCGLLIWENNRAHAREWAEKSAHLNQRTGGHLYLPRLAEVVREGEADGRPLPFDMHEFAALIAPRAFLNVSAANDESGAFASAFQLAETGAELQRVWDLWGQSPRFVNVMVGGGHDVPSYCVPFVLTWFQYWLRATDIVRTD